MAVQILRAVSSATVIAVDTDPGKLEHARGSGADGGVESGEGAAEQIRELTAGHGAELVLDMVGADSTIELGAAIARPEADLTVVGLAGEGFDFRFGATAWEVSLSIPYWGSQVELMEVLELARRGLIAADVHRFSLDQAPDAYAKLRAGDVQGRAVVTP